MRDELGRYKKGCTSSYKDVVTSNSYMAIHHWTFRYVKLGKKCEQCGKSNVRLEKANLDHSYRRDVNDYRTLCVQCHRYYDMFNNKYYENWIESRKGATFVFQ